MFDILSICSLLIVEEDVCQDPLLYAVAEDKKCNAVGFTVY